MNRRSFGVFYSAILVLLLSVWGCSSSSSDPSISGQGPEGVSKALVCLDSNDNYICDNNEPATRTLNTGIYSLPVSSTETSAHRLLWVADSETVDGATGAPLPTRHTLVSLKDQPQVISIFTTLLSVQSTLDEAAIKTALHIGEETSLYGNYAKGGDIDLFSKHLDDLYAGMYAAAAAAPEATPGANIDKVVALMVSKIENSPQSLIDHVDKMTFPPPPLLSSPPPTSTIVGEEIFQSIPIDAATMSFGVGMDEITRKVVSGSYCLDVAETLAVPKLAISQNSKTYIFRLIKSEKDLRELLNVGGGLDLGTQVIQGSLEGRFVSEYRSDTSAIYALIKAETILSGYKLFGVGLDGKYLQNDANVASYLSNYDAFRRACGDRYLDQVTTGGAYYGLLKITSSDSTKKQDLQVKLDGKYGKAGISVKVSGDLKSNLQETLSSTNIAITVGSRGVSPQYLGLSDPKNQLINSLDTFFEAANQFMTAISLPTINGKANECYNDSLAPKKCAYTASFADYATISGGVPRSQTQVKNLNFTTKLMGQYEDYNILQDMVSDIMINEPDYDWSKRTDITSDDIWDRKGDLETGQLLMDSAFRKCSTDFIGCSENTAAANLPSFFDVIINLPKRSREYASDCQDLQRIYGPADRTGATVYLGGDKTKPFKVSCTRMDTSQPETYLEIANTSGTTSSLSYNMAQNVNPDGSLVSSIYKKVRVNVNLNNLEFINDQGDELETSSTAATDSPTLADNFVQARLGSAVDCYAQTGKAISNIDLTGTKFKFDDNLSYVTDVHPSSKYEWVSDYKTWDEADAYAKSKGGHLVVIDNQAEWDSVYSMMRSQHNIDTWIGLKRTDKGQPQQYQQFQWVTTLRNLTGSEVASYFFAGEPNNYKNNEDCVHFWFGKQFKLNDISCGYKIPSLIEYEVNVPDGVSTFNFARTAVDVSMNGSAPGVCSEIRPTTNVIRLQYVIPAP